MLHSPNNKKGFALISVLTVVVLMAVIAIALLTLVTLNTRREGLAKNQDQARTNAKLALVEAIATLQETSGSDTSITFPADVFSDDIPGQVYPRQLVGVSESWKGDDHNAGGRAFAPDYGAKFLTFNPANPDDGGKFRRWLINDAEDLGADSPPDLTPGDGKVVLLGDGTLGTNPDKDDLEVHSTPSFFSDGSGSLAWWVSGNNQKAKPGGKESPTTTDLEIVDSNLVSPGVSSDAIGVTGSNEDDRSSIKDLLAQGTTLKTLDLISDAASDSNDDITVPQLPSEAFLDVTNHAIGLQTNSATGGWKRDLSLFSEITYGNLGPADTFPSFTLDADNSPTSVMINEPDSYIYPWVTGGENVFFGASQKWPALTRHMKKYEIISNQDGTAIAGYEGKVIFGDEGIEWQRENLLSPIMARIHMELALHSFIDSDNKYYAAVQVTPIVTMWNPYSVALDTSTMNNVEIVLHNAACPLSFDFETTFINQSGQANGIEEWKDTDLIRIITGRLFDSDDYYSKELAQVHLQVFINSAAASGSTSGNLWQPGEARVFSPNNLTIVEDPVNEDNLENYVYKCREGYRPDSGYSFAISKKRFNNDFGVGNRNGAGRTLRVKSSAEMNVLVHDGAVGQASTRRVDVKGLGSYWTWIDFEGEVSNKAFARQNLLPLVDAHKMFGEEVQLSEQEYISSDMLSLSQNKRVFAYISYGTRFARDVNPERDNIVVGGMHNLNPISLQIESSKQLHEFRDDPNDPQPGPYYQRETSHDGRFDAFPENFLFFPADYTEGAPSGIDNSSVGYVGGGFDVQFGVPNMIISEVPNKPLTSIGDLTHFNMNYTAKRPPYVMSPFLNSMASPFIPMEEFYAVGDTFVISAGADDSYLTNHFLADDYFISGITPDTGAWETSSTRTIEAVLQDWLDEEEDLPVHNYKPARENMSADDIIADQDSWLKIASEIKVDGMFNINSTSVRAWSMLLKKNFDGETSKYLSYDSTSNSIVQNEVTEGYVFPRTAVSSDVANAGDGSLLTTPIVFTDEHINTLAENIVEEIKRRGPFLSLSEFYNRQLSEDPELAKSGAVESALEDFWSNPDDSGPYAELLAVFSDEASTVDFNGDPLEYPFPEAAEGFAAYGYPAWTRQADILRPIAGVLSPRDDTFTIRAYGDVRDRNGNPVTQAWCEAVVERSAEYVDSDMDQKDKLANEPFVSDVNRLLGRRYKVVQFRWLSEDEV